MFRRKREVGDLDVEKEVSMEGGEVSEEVLCAWCLREQGIDPGEGSHGICVDHAAQMFEQYRRLRRRR